MEVALPAVEVQTVRVLKQGVGATELLGAFVHGIDERLEWVIRRGVDIRSDRCGDGHGGIVTAVYHEARERFFHGERVAFLELYIRLAYGRRGMVDGHDVGELAVLEGEQGGHDLGSRCDSDRCVCVALEQDGSVLCHEHGVRTDEIRQLGGIDTAFFSGFSQDDVGRVHFSERRHGGGGDRQRGGKGES